MARPRQVAVWAYRNPATRNHDEYVSLPKNRGLYVFINSSYNESPK